jgi:hypothetical protein
MPTEEQLVTAAYLEHLSDADVSLLAGRAFGEVDLHQLRRMLAERRGGIDDLLAKPQVFDAIFGPEGAPFVQLSPFLAFAVAIDRVMRKLETASYVPERAGWGKGALVFDTARLAEFGASPWRRLFLAELLASYTRVASGSVLVASRRGWRRQRFSELDPVRLAALLDVVPEAERPGVLRRLGDLALFLTGVFPDYVERHGFGPVAEGRLRRVGGLAAQRQAPRDRARPAPDWVPGTGDEGPLALLEQLGRRCYEAAFASVPRPVPASLAVLGELPGRFDQARRVLSLVTDTFLFPVRGRWFGFGPDTGP